MTTITAKKLRENLSEYLDKLQAGEEIIIIRHSEVIGSLKPTKTLPTPNGQAIGDMLKRNKEFFKANKELVPKTVSAKAMYHQALDEKYGL
jgi:antitoxin (DNA-binding transcriptional repressor) of toxin-antitoxin stability system